MKKIKVSELSGAALDFAVALCRMQDIHFDLKTKTMAKEFPCFNPQSKRVYTSLGMMEAGYDFRPSSNWAQGGPIIEREAITVSDGSPVYGLEWMACDRGSSCIQHGPTYLIAAMRCYVASKLGDTVEVPEELL